MPWIFRIAHAHLCMMMLEYKAVYILYWIFLKHHLEKNKFLSDQFGENMANLAKKTDAAVKAKAPYTALLWADIK